jgi:hypothetical protein
MAAETCSWIKDYQTIIVGTVGFSGVIFTLFINGLLSRIAHEREVQHRKKTLRTALLAELRWNQDWSNNLKANSSNTFLSFRAFNEIYRANLGNIGLLDYDEVRSITIAYHVSSEIAAAFEDLPTGKKLEPENYESTSLDEAIAVLAKKLS